MMVPYTVVSHQCYLIILKKMSIVIQSNYSLTVFISLHVMNVVSAINELDVVVYWVSPAYLDSSNSGSHSIICS